MLPETQEIAAAPTPEDHAAKVRWPDPELELILRNPITFKDEVFGRLLLREPTGGEWEQIVARPAVDRRRFAVSLIAGVPMGAVAKMGIGDVVRAEEYLNSFYEVAQVIAAGEKAS